MYANSVASKEGVIARQVMLWRGANRRRFTLYHEVFDGNTAEVTTPQGVIKELSNSSHQTRHRGGRPRSVVHRQPGRLTDHHLAWRGVLEFILAVPGRRYGDFVELLEPIHSRLCAHAKKKCWVRPPGTSCD